MRRETGPSGAAVHAAFRRPPRHQEADALLVGVLLGKLGEDPSLEHHQHAVGERQDLAELGRDEQDGAAAVALGDELLVDILGRADVEAARRLLGDQERRLVREFARHDDLLQVAARERADIDALIRDADGEPADEQARPLGDRGRVDEPAAGERG